MPEPAGTEDQAALESVLDAARGLAADRLGELDAADAPIAPFAVVRSARGLTPVLLDDVAEHLATPEGTSRVAGSLLHQFDADAFALATPWHASPDGRPDHPQAREVLRIIVGHVSGRSGAVYAEIERRPEGPRLAPVWETIA
jgi:hypothetical protein